MNNNKLLQMIEEHEDDIIAVLAGHLHFFNESHISGEVKQFVSSQGITGYMNRFVIGKD